MVARGLSLRGCGALQELARLGPPRDATRARRGLDAHRLPADATDGGGDGRFLVHPLARRPTRVPFRTHAPRERARRRSEVVVGSRGPLSRGGQDRLRLRQQPLPEPLALDAGAISGTEARRYVSRPSRPEGNHSLNRERNAVPYSVDNFRISKALPAPGHHPTAYPSSTTTCRELWSNIGGNA